jgi:drug/metabolite transporter (DMT)-like permease
LRSESQVNWEACTFSTARYLLAALILSLESVFAVLSGWLLLNEKLIFIQIFGCVLIFVAVVLSQFKEWNSGTMDKNHLVEGR